MDRYSETTHIFPTTSPPCETSDDVKYSEYKPSGTHNQHRTTTRNNFSLADLGVCFICLDLCSRS